MIFKDPKTDTGMKKSQKGRVKVISNTEYVDQLSKGEDEDGLLTVLFENGKLFYTTFDKVKENLNNSSVN